MSHETDDSGERRTQRLEIKLAKIIEQIDNMPGVIELTVIKAINAHHDSCKKSRPSLSPDKSANIWAGHAGKIIAGLLTALTTLLAFALTR
jgi:hypothetical protein